MTTKKAVWKRTSTLLVVSEHGAGVGDEEGGERGRREGEEGLGSHPAGRDAADF